MTTLPNQRLLKGPDFFNMELSLGQHAMIALCILMLGTAGVTSAETAQNETEDASIPEYAFYFPIEINNRVFNVSLLNPHSSYYKQMYAEVSGVFFDVYNCSTCYMQPFYRGVVDMTFSNGSVIANSTIVFQTFFVNAVLLKNIFMMSLPEIGVINGLQIDPTFTEEESTPIPAPLPTTGPATTTPLTRTTTILKSTSITISNKTTISSPNKTSSLPPHISTNVTTSPYNNSSTNGTTKPSDYTNKTTSPSINSNKPSSSTTKKGSPTEPILLPTTSPPAKEIIYYPYRGIPAWAIALLVLACIILLLLIILLIITLVRWCCGGEKEKQPEPMLEVPPTPYERTTFKEPLSTPTYSPHTPQKSPMTPVLSPFEDPSKPKVNRTGMYVVNPES